MPISREKELEDIIENMEDGYESIKLRHKKEKQELIEEVIQDIKWLYFESDGDFNPKSAVLMFAETKQKWEERSK